MDDEWLSTYPKKMPSAHIEDEALAQCFLRLIIRFQAEVGVPFDHGEPEKWCAELEVDDLMASPEGEQIREAMADVELSFEFQDEYETLLKELDHHRSSFAHRLAFNQLMDTHWDEMKQQVLRKIQELSPGTRIGR